MTHDELAAYVGVKQSPSGAPGFWYFTIAETDGEWSVLELHSTPPARCFQVYGEYEDETRDRADRLCALINTYGLEFGERGR